MRATLASPAMDAKGRQLVVGEARRWAGLGLIDPADLPRIEALYESEGDEGPAFTQLALLALAGAVLGAAIIAFVLVVLRLEDQAAAWAMAALGSAALAGGAAATAWRHRPAWADTLLTAGAIAYGVMSFPDERSVGKALCILALLGGIALPFLGTRRGAVSALGAALFMAGGFAFMMQWFSTPGFIFDNPTKLGATIYLVLGVAYVAGVVWARRWWGQAWPGASGVAGLGLVVPLVFFLDTVVLTGHAQGGTIQFLVGLAEGGLLGVAFAVHDRALVVGSSIGVAGAAVAFAFDVGGPTLGVVVLLLVAASLVALAFRVRRGWAAPDAQP